MLQQLLFARALLSHSQDMPLEDDFSSQDSDHESGDEDNENPNDSPMMSIFASYYGIEESEADNKPKGTIDDVNFDPEAYVKV